VANLLVPERVILAFVTEKILTYRASYDDLHLLDENNLRFTDFCRQGFNSLKNKDKQDINDKVVLRLLLIVLGGVAVGLTPLISNLVIVMLEYCVGITMVLVGTISLVLLWRNERNARRIL